MRMLAARPPHLRGCIRTSIRDRQYTERHDEKNMTEHMATTGTASAPGTVRHVTSDALEHFDSVPRVDDGLHMAAVAVRPG